MAVFTINCPDCKASLKSPKAIPAGKVITCPKCQVMFAAPAAKPVMAKTGPATVDDEEIIEDVEMVDEPKKAAPKPARPSRPKGKKKPKSHAPLIIGLALGLIIVVGLGVGGFQLVKFLMAENLDVVAYMPNKCPLILGGNIRKLGDSPVSPLLDTLFAGSEVAKYAEATGSSPKALVENFAMGMMPRVGYLPTGSGVWTTRTPIDKAKLTAAIGGASAQFGGREVVQRGQNPAQSNFLVGKQYCVEVTGAQGDAEDTIRTAGRNRPDGSMAELVERASKADLWVVLNPNGAGIAEMMKPGMAAAGAKPSTDELLNVKAFGLWATFTSSELEVHGAISCYDINTAKTFLEQGKKMIEEMKTNPGNSPPELVESAKVELKEKTIEFSGRFKNSSVESGMKQLEPLMGMMRMLAPKPAAPAGGGGGRW